MSTQPTLLPAKPAKPAKTPGIPTSQVLEALIRHYRKPGKTRSGEILITEAQAPGSSLRRCDLIRVGMWASRGTGIDGHEIKTSRPDWLRELDAPAKAEPWWPYCSRWWVVAVPGVVAPGELPEGWGLMELPSSGRRFKVKAQPAVKQPKLTVGLLVELLRRADNERLAEMDQLHRRHQDEMYRREQEIRREKATPFMPQRDKDRLEFVTLLEKALGLEADLHAWEFARELTRMTPEEAAAALEGGADQVAAQRRLTRAARRDHELRRAATSVLAELDRDDAELKPPGGAA